MNYKSKEMMGHPMKNSKGTEKESVIVQKGKKNYQARKEDVDEKGNINYAGRY